ncbi:MAG: ABC transporter ATP-binding protein/permease [Clostridia bacterium]|nr:ABC transporter ATP-binding protein/permease [Clostridia bacterium]
MIKQLAGCVRQYKKYALLSPFFVTLEVVMEVIIPFLMATLIDKGINEGNMNAILNIGGLLVLFAVLSLTFGALAGRYAAKASAGYARNLRHDMYHNVQEFSFSNIDKFQTSSIITRLTTDVTNVQNAFQMIIRVAVRSPIMMIFSLVMAFSVNHKISLIFLASIPFIGIGLYLIIKNAHPVFERVFRTYDVLNRIVQENLRGIRVVKSYVREEYEKSKFEKVSTQIYRDFSTAERIVALSMPLMQFGSYISILFISWIGARLIVSSEMTTGQLMSIITYASQILMSLMMLSMIFVMITISRASAERISELLEEKSNLKNGENPIYEVKNGDISFKNVSFGYTSNKICLSNINIDIKSGETVGIIGGTGSSKTTLVQLIPRLYDATEGEGFVGGENVRDYDIHTLRNEVSMVLQKNVLFSGTIKENLRWGCEDASDEELVRVCKLAQAHEFIMSFPKQYDTYIEQEGTNVSGGQKQRLCIARAILKKPKILILDDSTSAVDTRTDSLIRKAFREEIPDTTKIIIAQRISSVEDADKIIIMDNGSVNDVGTHEQLLERNPIYQEIYYSQMKGGDKSAAVISK